MSKNKHNTMEGGEYVNYLADIYSSSTDKEYIDFEVLITGNIFMLKKKYLSGNGISRDLLDDILVSLHEKTGRW